MASGIQFAATTIEVLEFAGEGLGRVGEAAVVEKSIPVAGGPAEAAKPAPAAGGTLWEQLDKQRKALEESKAAAADPRNFAPKGLDDEESAWLDDQAERDELRERDVLEAHDHDKVAFQLARQAAVDRGIVGTGAKAVVAAAPAAPRAATAAAAPVGSLRPALVPKLARKPAASSAASLGHAASGSGGAKVSSAAALASSASEAHDAAAAAARREPLPPRSASNSESAALHEERIGQAGPPAKRARTGDAGDGTAGEAASAASGSAADSAAASAAAPKSGGRGLVGYGSSDDDSDSD